MSVIKQNGDIMKIIIFGTGVFYAYRQDVFLEDEIVAFIDNDKNKWYQEIDNIPVLPPNHIKEVSYDKIVVMSRQKEEIKVQLIKEFEVDEALILDFNGYCEFCARVRDSCEMIIHYKKNCFYLNKNKTKVLIITYALNYGGGSLAAFYAALALKEKGFNVVIVSRKADKRLIDEMTNKGVTIITQELLDWSAWEQIRWIEQFDYIIVNTLQLGRIIKEVICKKPVFWWIHESKIEYEYLDKSLIESIDNINVNTYVVSEVAFQTFRQYFHKINAHILHYGIPDNGFNNTCFSINGKLIFAVIGGIIPIKGQDVFLRAIESLVQEERDKSEFWIIGASSPENQYGNSVLKKAESMPEVKWLGELNREEIERIYMNIDVVVVPSRQETMSIVMTEAFMYRKVGIASNVIGMAKYIEHEENGLIFENENVSDLAKKISWVLNNRSKLSVIGGKARQTYDRYFNLRVFGDKLEKIIRRDVKRIV